MTKTSDQKPFSPAEPFHLEGLQDLERLDFDRIRKLRAHERIDIQAHVEIEPGNASTPRGAPEAGLVVDISKNGCRAIFTRPIGVGDIYRLRFDRTEIELPILYARCLRCRLTSDESFEAGFALFAPLDLALTDDDDDNESMP